MMKTHTLAIGHLKLLYHDVNNILNQFYSLQLGYMFKIEDYDAILILLVSVLYTVNIYLKLIVKQGKNELFHKTSTQISFRVHVECVCKVLV